MRKKSDPGSYPHVARGLEGWTVFIYAFDEFYDYKLKQWLLSPPDLGGLFNTKEDLAAAFAAQWVMIPITRAKDTLVINASTRPSRLKDVLNHVHERRCDFVEWITMNRAGFAGGSNS